MKQALIVGCSHALGAEIEKGPGVATSSSKEYFSYGVTRSYPAKIAKALGYSIVNNESVSGGSNDAMFRIFEGTSTGPDDLVIACWTGVNRGEIYDNSKWHAIAPGKDIDHQYQDYFREWIAYGVSDESGRLNKFKNIVALNAMACIRGTKVININSFWPIHGVEEHGYWPVSDPFFDWCLDRNFAKTDWGHYFEDAHQAFADHVLKAIGDRFSVDQ